MSIENILRELAACKAELAEIEELVGTRAVGEAREHRPERMFATAVGIKLHRDYTEIEKLKAEHIKDQNDAIEADHNIAAERDRAVKLGLDAVEIAFTHDTYYEATLTLKEKHCLREIKAELEKMR